MALASKNTRKNRIAGPDHRSGPTLFHWRAAEVSHLYPGHSRKETGELVVTVDAQLEMIGRIGNIRRAFRRRLHRCPVSFAADDTAACQFSPHLIALDDEPAPIKIGIR